MDPELYRDVRRLKTLMKQLDKADGRHDGVIHKSIALEHLKLLKEKKDKLNSLRFLEAVEAFIDKGPETQRRLSNSEIDVIAAMVKQYARQKKN